MFSQYYWTEFKDKNGLKCLVKHTGFNFNPNHKPGPFFYEIPNTQQARTLLSAAESVGHQEKGLNTLRWHTSKHNQTISEKPYTKYGGLLNMNQFRRNNKPDFPYEADYKLRAKQEGVPNHLILFESQYTKEKLNKLIEKVKAESANTPVDKKYPFQSETDLQQIITADLKLLNKNSNKNTVEQVEFLMQLVIPAQIMIWPE